MDPNKFLRKEKKVAGTTKVKVVKIDYIDRNYKIKVLSNHPTTKTGLVEVIQLFSENPHLLRFIFRWDEKNEELDIDIYRNESICNELWSEKRYKGHHTQRVIDNGRIFKINISVPDKRIFKGKVNVGLFIKLSLKDSIKSTDSISIIHKKIILEDHGRGTNNLETKEV